MLPLIDLSRYSHFEVTKSRRIPVYGMLGLLFICVYFFTNQFHIVPPRYLTLMEWEKNLPLMPWTVWVYVSDYIYPFVIGILLQSNLITTRVCFAFFIQTVIANASFFLFPVTFPRELWPHDPSDFMLDIIRSADGAANCFPSSHVAIVFLTYLAWYRERPKQHWPFLIWGLLICASTLTTKQHYFVDVLAGVVLGVFSYVVAEAIVQKNPVEKS